MVTSLPSALTIGEIAKRTGYPLHRVRYVIDSRGIKPVSRAGCERRAKRPAPGRWVEIRRRVLTGEISKRAACQEYGLQWRTLQRVLEHELPAGYQRKEPRQKPKLERFLPVIHEILKQDQKAPKKQRHTAQRIFDRLQGEHHYNGGLTIVKDAVRAWKQRQAEVLVPLAHRPGEAQVDFGEAHAKLRGEQVKVAMFVMTLPYSDAIFCQVFPKECTEAFQEGHKRAFEFFGGVPRRISYDNSKIAVAKITGGRGREVTREFLRLESHFLFEHHFCLVRRPNEKGHVENLLGYARRNYLVPVPETDSLEGLNAQLQERCCKDLGRKLRGKPATKEELLVEEKTWFLAIGGIDEVRLVVEHRLVARHPRHWGKEHTEVDPVHYLALLERKPGAFDYARPLENWRLPDCFGVLRRRQEAELEKHGTREFIKVLRLLEHATLPELSGAVEYALSIGANSADAVRLILQARQEKPVNLFCLDGRPHLKGVHVPLPNLQA